MSDSHLKRTPAMINNMFMIRGLDEQLWSYPYAPVQRLLSKQTILQILQYLVGPSYDDIVLRRMVSHLACHSGNNANLKHHTVGSAADGFSPMFISDRDFMIIPNIFISNIIGDIKSCQLGKQVQRRYIFDAMQVSTTLDSSMVKIIHHVPTIYLTNFKRDIERSIISYNNQLLLSSTLLKLNISDDQTIAGPSVVNLLNLQHSFNSSTVHGGRLDDFVFSLPSEHWPLSACEWRFRNRPYKWPTLNTINAITNIGYHFVPIGDATSRFRDLHWRHSFAMAEQYLIKKFSFFQLMIYGAMKIIKCDLLSIFKDCVCQECSIGNSVVCSYPESYITSFHIKVIMFWVIENTPSTLWKKDRLIECIRLCLQMLMSCVNQGFIPHYFIPSRNLITKKLHPATRTSMLAERRQYIRSPIWALSKCPTIKYFSNMNEILKTEREFYNLPQSHVGPLPYKGCGSCINATPPLKRLNHLLRCFGDIPVYLQFLVFKHLAGSQQNAAALFMSTCVPKDKNKSIYGKRRKAKHSCFLGAQIDKISGWTYLATYFYCVGQYRQVEIMLRDHIHFQYLYEFDIYNPSCYTKIEYFFNGFTILENTFKTTDNQRLYPIEFEQDTKWTFRTVIISSIHYIIFLQFLCAYHLDNHPRQIETYEELKNEVRTRRTILLGSPDTGLNLLGICSEMLGEYDRAISYYWESFGKKHGWNFAAAARFSNLIREHFTYNQELTKHAENIENIISHKMSLFEYNVVDNHQ